jgi:hypothetical protein
MYHFKRGLSMDESDKRRPPFPGPDRFEIRTQPGVAALSRRRTFNPYPAPARLPVGVQGRSETAFK